MRRAESAPDDYKETEALVALILQIVRADQRHSLTTARSGSYWREKKQLRLQTRARRLLSMCERRFQAKEKNLVASIANQRSTLFVQDDRTAVAHDERGISALDEPEEREDREDEGGPVDEAAARLLWSES
jgi:hypothetical protein